MHRNSRTATAAIVVMDVARHKRTWEWDPYQAKDLQLATVMLLVALVQYIIRRN